MLLARAGQYKGSAAADVASILSLRSGAGFNETTLNRVCNALSSYVQFCGGTQPSVYTFVTPTYINNGMESSSSLTSTSSTRSGISAPAGSACATYLQELGDMHAVIEHTAMSFFFLSHVVWRPRRRCSSLGRSR